MRGEVGLSMGRSRGLVSDGAGGGIGGGSGPSGDELTFGPGASGNTSWDQFATNEKLFGVKTDFDENIYTTKLDRSGPNFKEREREAQRIANEIQGVRNRQLNVDPVLNIRVDGFEQPSHRRGTQSCR